MPGCAGEEDGHVAPAPAPEGGAELRLVRTLLERSRAWSTCRTHGELLARAARDVAEVLDVDAGYFVYRPPAAGDGPFEVYAPWGPLVDRLPELWERANRQAAAAPSPLGYLSERWLTRSEVPPAVRQDWERWAIAQGGSWPIVAGGQRVGALVARRRRVPPRDDAPLVALCALQLSLLLELQELRRQAEAQSEHDELTGLLNRRGLARRLPALRELAERTCTSLLLSVVDVDGLKRVNDTAGHPEGDRLLREIGRALDALGGQDGLVARIGGDEFAVVRRVAAGEEARARARLDRLLARAGRGWRATAGHAAFGPDGAEWDAVYAAADARLYARRRRRP
jgi:diguanylate cyclase (GGDEF)-like protein